MKKIALLTLALMLLSTTLFLVYMKPVLAQGTIYIRSDGEVVGTTKIQRDGNLYTFNDNIFNQSIVVEKDNIVVDGADYTIQGPEDWDSVGIDLTGRNNVTINNMEIEAFGYGILVNTSSNIVLSGNLVRNNGVGIWITMSSYNQVYENEVSVYNITYGWAGIYLLDSSYNNIYDNTITEIIEVGGITLGGSSNNYIYRNNLSNGHGIWLSSSSNNLIVQNNVNMTITDGYFFHSQISSCSDNVFYHNNFLMDKNQMYIYDSVNIWDNGYPSGGNYWSNYSGVDGKSGPNQDQASSDGMGDTPYEINANNTDNYPSMGMYSDFEATSEHHVQTICNSSISDFQFNGTAIIFNVSGEDGATGFCRILLPTVLMNEPYTVLVNGTEISYVLLPSSNQTHSYLYFTYSHSTQEVMIVPEFPALTLIFLTLIILATATVFYKRRLIKTPIH